MRQNVLLRQRVTPQRVQLPNGTWFLVRYETVSRKNLPSNVTIRRTRTIGPRNRNRQIRKKKVRFPPSTTQRVAKRIVRKYKNQGKRRKAQTGGWGVCLEI